MSLQEDRDLIRSLLRREPEDVIRKLSLDAWERIEASRIHLEARLSDHLEANRENLSPSDLRLHGFLG
jgi:hypothetical protein